MPRPPSPRPRAQVPLAHPDDPDLAFLYGTVLTDGADAWSEQPTANICVFAAREVDRSPTGQRRHPRLALQHARGRHKGGAAGSRRGIDFSDVGWV